jgi:hypothetical protein
MDGRDEVLTIPGHLHANASPASHIGLEVDADLASLALITVLRSCETTPYGAPNVRFVDSVVIGRILGMCGQFD